MAKFPRIKIYNKDIEVAKSSDDGEKILLVRDDIDYPFDLFGPRGFHKKEVGYLEFTKWFKSRAFPEERVGVEVLLKELGLKEYSAIKVAMHYEGRLASDDISVKWED